LTVVAGRDDLRDDVLSPVLIKTLSSSSETAFILSNRRCLCFFPISPSFALPTMAKPLNYDLALRVRISMLD